jgi:hypothetical protein
MTLDNGRDEMLTFEQFQQTRQRVADVNDAVGMASDEPASGFVYRDDLHIFDMPEAGQFLLVIGNQQKISSDLTDLERDLYDYGLREGMLS